MTQSNNLRNLNNELEDLLINIDESNRPIIRNQINNFEKDCLKITNKVFPNFTVPVYMDVHEIDDNKLNSKTSWEYYKNPKNKFGNLADNYCRDIYGNGNYVYPVRNPNTGVVYLKSCDTYYNQELKDISNLKNDMSVLIAKARNTILQSDLSSSKNKDNVKKELENKLAEFEDYQQKYIQLVKLIDNFNVLLNDKRETVNKNSTKFDKLNNTFNIKRDNENVFNDTYYSNKKRNERMIYYAKILIFICWLIVFGLFALININRVIY